MNKRKYIEECLDIIYQHYLQLKDLVENTPDESIQDSLEGRFNEFTDNIACNFDFLETVITRKGSCGLSSTESDSKMTNDELEKYFEENWDLLILL